jgi:HD-GYP domain-containing protein (c-di-GMP phosphodiesterase class II)
MAVSSRQFRNGSDPDHLADSGVDEREFFHLLGLELERAKRGDHPLTVLVGRIEREPSTDDRDGGDNGTAAEVVGSILAERKRRIDTAGVLSDGRFGLVLPDTDEYGAMMIGERLHAAVLEQGGAAVTGPDLGIAAFPRHGRTPEELIRAADRGRSAARTLAREGSIAVNGRALVLTAPPLRRDGSEPGEWLQALLALAETVDVRDHLASGHAQLVGRYAELIAREFSFPDSAVRLIRLAGVLHDIGKFVVPKDVFQKPGPLNESEWREVRRHPEVGARLLEEAELDDVAEWVRDHHEQPDGGGYPHGLKAGEISLEARLLSVADAYEAMTTERAHRPALSHAAAREELTRCAGTHFDRRVVQAFLRQLERQCPVRVESAG